VDLGFDERNLLLFRVDPRLSGYRPDQVLPLYDRLAERLRAVPGVTAVAISRHPLLANSARIRLTEVPGHGTIPTYLNPVDPGFFATMNIPIVSGRAFTARDDRTAPKVAVVNETAARQLLGTDNPLGRQMRLDRGPGNTYEVVGVTRDAKYTDVRQQVPATVYTPLRQEAGGQVNFEVRTAADPLALVGGVRAAVHEVDGNLPIFDVKTQVERADATIAQERLFARLSSSFGGVALLLAAIGLFGVMSYAVARRTSEIAIRLALGAKRNGVLLMVMRETLTMVIAGAAIGIPCALAAARLTQHALADVLYGVKPTDPLTFAMAAAGLLAVGVVAAYVPARRAARVDPMVALRYE
jgi:predicted permease